MLPMLVDGWNPCLDVSGVRAEVWYGCVFECRLEAPGWGRIWLPLYRH